MSASGGLSGQVETIFFATTVFFFSDRFSPCFLSCVSRLHVAYL